MECRLCLGDEDDIQGPVGGAGTAIWTARVVMCIASNRVMMGGEDGEDKVKRG
jgi:hypothetical protein